MKQSEYLFQPLYATGEFSSESLLAESNFCNSALVILYHYSSRAGQAEYSQNPDHDLCQFGTSGFQSLVPKLDAYARHIQSILPYNIDQSSPLVANCLYRTAVWLSDLPDDMVRPDYPSVLDLMKTTLLKLASRWKVAGK